MIKELQQRNARRSRRKMSIRKGVRGTTQRPRLSVFKSNRNICAQLIDDERGVTLASSGTMTKQFQDRKWDKKGKESARQVGVCIAELAKQQNIQYAVFDRGFHKYHGLLSEVANGARETGLQF